METIRKFVAIDFETATPDRMPCQIGICVVQDGEIVEEYSSFIQPPHNKYSRFCINVHGITPEVTANAPSFPEVWKEISHLFNEQVVVAHNAPFDIGVLSKVIGYYNLKEPRIKDVYCTYEITGRPLRDIIAALDLSEAGHHDALFDARVCAKLFSMILTDPDSYVDLEEQHDDEIEDIEFSLEPSEAIKGLRFVFSGVFQVNREMLVDIVRESGGLVLSSVSSKTDYLVIADTPGPAKLAKAKELGIPILSEMEFIFKFFHCTDEGLEHLD